MPLRFADVLARVQRGYTAQPKEWTAVGPWMSVPYIGSFFSMRMEEGGFHTPLSFAEQVKVWLRGTPADQLRDRLIRIVQSACQDRRANQCVRGYHTRDFHPACYLSLLAVLHILHDTFRGRARFPVTREQIAQAAAAVNWRQKNAATCGCIRSPVACNANDLCKWVAPAGRDVVGVRGLLPQAIGGTCVPQNPRANGFTSIIGFYGQKASFPPAANATVRPGSKYRKVGNVQWRSPSPLTTTIPALSSRMRSPWPVS